MRRHCFGTASPASAPPRGLIEDSSGITGFCRHRQRQEPLADAAVAEPPRVLRLEERQPEQRRQELHDEPFIKDLSGDFIGTASAPSASSTTRCRARPTPRPTARSTASATARTAWLQQRGKNTLFTLGELRLLHGDEAAARRVREARPRGPLPRARERHYKHWPGARGVGRRVPPRRRQAVPARRA